MEFYSEMWLFIGLFIGFIYIFLGYMTGFLSFVVLMKIFKLRLSLKIRVGYFF